MKEQSVSRIDLPVRSDNPHALEVWETMVVELASYRLW
jgi:hypothetical protein